MKKNKKIILILIFLLLVVALIMVVLEKSGITNFYTSQKTATSSNQQTGEVPSASPTNTVDYGPAETNDTTTIPEKDSNLQTQNPVNENLIATITSTRKSSDGSNYLIKVAVSGTESGTCKVVATKNSLNISVTSEIGLSGSQLSCLDLKIPISSLESGTWNINVTVADMNGATTETSSTMEVIL